MKVGTRYNRVVQRTIVLSESDLLEAAKKQASNWLLTCPLGATQAFDIEFELEGDENERMTATLRQTFTYDDPSPSAPTDQG